MGNGEHVARDLQVVGFYFHVRFFVFAPVVFVFVFFLILCFSSLSPFSLSALGVATRVFPAKTWAGWVGSRKEVGG